MLFLPRKVEQTPKKSFVTTEVLTVGFPDEKYGSQVVGLIDLFLQFSRYRASKWIL